MARVLNEVDMENSGMDKLVSKMKEKMVVSVDNLNWEEAGTNLKWAILLRLASGKAIQKNLIENIVTKIWKISEPASFIKVEKATLLVILKTSEDQTEFWNGALGLMKEILFCCKNGRLE